MVVAVTNGRLDFGTRERICSGQAEWLARESWRPAAEAGAGRDHQRVGFDMVMVTTADPLYGQTGEQPWNHEKAILSPVGEFINSSPCD